MSFRYDSPFLDRNGDRGMVEMVGLNSGLSKDEIVRELARKARELWGDKRAEEIGPGLAQMADFLHQVAQNLPDKEEEPAFFW